MGYGAFQGPTTGFVWPTAAELAAQRARESANRSSPPGLQAVMSSGSADNSSVAARAATAAAAGAANTASTTSASTSTATPAAGAVTPPAVGGIPVSLNSPLRAQLSALIDSTNAAYLALVKSGREAAAFNLRDALERTVRAGSTVGVSPWARQAAIRDLQAKTTASVSALEGTWEAKRLQDNVNILGQIGALDTASWNQNMSAWQAAWNANQQAWQNSFNQNQAASTQAYQQQQIELQQQSLDLQRAAQTRAALEASNARAWNNYAAANAPLPTNPSAAEADARMAAIQQQQQVRMSAAVSNAAYLSNAASSPNSWFNAATGTRSSPIALMGNPIGGATTGLSRDTPSSTVYQWGQPIEPSSSYSAGLS